MYAGRGKGADVAAWKQAVRAEAAAAAVQTSKSGRGVRSSALGPHQAFREVPHAILARKAAKLGYPLWILRLPLAAYRLPRSLRIAGVYSFLVVACRGATTGSGTATAEMKIMVVDIIDGAL